MAATMTTTKIPAKKIARRGRAVTSTVTAEEDKGKHVVVVEHHHYFAFSFVHGDLTASVYIGYPDQKVSIPRLQAAKLEANMPKDAVLVGLGYMGFMSTEECDSLV